MSILYLVSLAILLVIYVVFIILMKHFKNELVTNIIFVSVVVVLYVVGLILNLNRNGFDDWNFQNALPVANVSPFMFAVCPLYFVLPKKLKQYFGALIALLSVGMLASPIISAIHNYVISYSFHTHFLLDYGAHITLSLWGIYLIQSKQVDLTIKNSLIGGGIIVAVALTMLIINLIADTSFFGLSLRGKHNIYNQVIVDNSFLSALIYFSALGAVLVIGYFFQRFLLKIVKR